MHPIKIDNSPQLVQHFVPTKVLDTGINNAHDGGRCIVNYGRQFVRGHVLNLDVTICETMTQNSLHRLMTQGTDLGAFRGTFEAGESFVDHVRELAVVEVAKQVNVKVLEGSVSHEVDKMSFVPIMGVLF